VLRYVPYLSVEVSISSKRVLVDLLNPLALKYALDSLNFSASLSAYGVLIED
tara:strand:- start:335 stop:490 length:156 start_codon:yes stop_codon:yes gene_type:complete